MSRHARPWYRSSRRQWYVMVNGKQHPLGVANPHGEAAAWQAFQALLQTARGNRPSVQSQFKTLAELVGAFLENRTDAGVKPDTVRSYRTALGAILARYGTETPHGLDAEAVSAFVASRKWASTTKAGRLCALETALRWAGLPTRFKKPRKESAGAGAVIPVEVWEKVKLVTQRDWRAVLAFLWLTGCRPQEAARLTAAQVDWSAGVAKIREHKTAHKGKDRQIYLCPDAVELLRVQEKKYGGGFLFRGKKGKPFSRQAFVMKLIRVSKRVGRRVTAYGFRHSFATRALEKGIPEAQVAAMLGHSGTTMLFKHYAHLTANARLLREQAAKVSA